MLVTKGIVVAYMTRGTGGGFCGVPIRGGKYTNFPSIVAFEGLEVTN